MKMKRLTAMVLAGILMVSMAQPEQPVRTRLKTTASSAETVLQFIFMMMEAISGIRMTVTTMTTTIPEPMMYIWEALHRSILRRTLQTWV